MNIPPELMEIRKLIEKHKKTRRTLIVLSIEKYLVIYSDCFTHYISLGYYPLEYKHELKTIIANNHTDLSKYLTEEWTEFSRDMRFKIWRMKIKLKRILNL